MIEASTQAHLRDEIAPRTLGAGKDLVVLSCGGLIGRQDWIDLAAARGCRIFVPSAAIAGLDGVKGAKVGAIDSVTMETRKPPQGLAGAPWIESQKIDLESITRETLIFEGTATEACRAFPANVNVVAALSLAGIGPERTRIRIFAAPEQPLNRHRITVHGEFGRLTIEIENVPSETCPRPSASEPDVAFPERCRAAIQCGHLLRSGRRLLGDFADSRARWRSPCWPGRLPAPGLRRPPLSVIRSTSSRVPCSRSEPFGWSARPSERAGSPGSREDGSSPGGPDSTRPDRDVLSSPRRASSGRAGSGAGLPYRRSRAS